MFDVCQSWWTQTYLYMLCMCVCEHDIWCMTCLRTMPGRGRERDRGRDSLKPAEAEYICMLGVYVYRLGRFVVLLPVACTEGHRIHRTGQSRTGQGRTMQGRTGQYSTELSSSCCKLTAHLDGRPTWRALMSCQIWVHRLWILMASHGSMNRPGDCHLWRISGLAATRHMQSRKRTERERKRERGGRERGRDKN